MKFLFIVYYPSILRTNQSIRESMVSCMKCEEPKFKNDVFKTLNKFEYHRWHGEIP